ncbi:MAG TPA: triphosphoribosyl-dephospho-CoA synthase [Hyphomicrobium sp.]|jgi:triphosphoribosyl-dephospho-CoA synthase
MSGLSDAQIGDLFLAACRAELNAIKPGNVHVHAGGHGMQVTQFEASAAAAAPFLAASGEKVGTRILRAVEASFAAAGCNTNLGILLLCAPLAAAAELPGDADLRDKLREVLNSFDDEDAAAVFAAIRLANPGGLGSVPEQDVADAPTVGLLEAMGLAASRDRIAAAYVTDYVEIFEFGLRVLANARGFTDDQSLAITTLHMAYLAYFPDSHVVRKYGPAAAETVREEARALVHLWQPVARRNTLAKLLDFDAELKRRNVNPGTTADLVVATVFVACMCDAMGPQGPP